MGNLENNENENKDNIENEKINLIDKDLDQEDKNAVNIPVPVAEPEIKFIDMNKEKNKKFENYEEEYNKLLEIKKNNLIYEFESLKKKLKKRTQFLI